MHAWELFALESGDPVSALTDLTKVRIENPKGDGRQRPIGIPVLEDSAEIHG
jgi:hypothetical protein